MSFILKSETRGDELVPSKTTVIATSEDRSVLENLKGQREKERDGWLANHGGAIPWWAECSIIKRETIEEVASI